MRPLGTSVLAGHDIPAQIDGDGVFAVHSTFLAEGFRRLAAGGWRLCRLRKN
ncbi:hypothetical protein [Pseudogemmobacter sp. W21_MBD1_M6]|uniref:hypothetical protein n=1 Tax=Pseudogemmobacter sp. W21_MBD1_M6 TaxID=3240271 RepID=UPI003F9979C3